MAPNKAFKIGLVKALIYSSMARHWKWGWTKVQPI